MSNNIKILKVIIKCSLQPTCYTIYSRNREIERERKYLCEEFPILYVPSVGKMKIRNKARKTLPIQIKCNNDAIQEKCFRKVIATRIVQYNFLPTKHIHPRLKDMAEGSPASNFLVKPSPEKVASDFESSKCGSVEVKRGATKT